MRRAAWLGLWMVFSVAGLPNVSAQTVLLPAADVAGSDGPGTAQSRELVDELLVLMQYDQMMDRIFHGTAEDVVRSVRVANPAMTDKDAGVVRELFEDAMRRNAPDLAQVSRKMLLQHYSEGELGELVAFYRTPTGQKSLRLTPTLTDEIAARTTDAMDRTIPPLLTALSKRLAAAGYRSPDYPKPLE